MPLFIFILLPLLEIWLMLRVGQIYGAFTGFSLIVLTALLGITLIYWQGQKLSGQMLGQLKNGKFNLGFLQDSFVVSFAGVLLFLPGFITDFFGLLLAIPFTRKLLINLLVPAKLHTDTNYQQTRSHQPTEEQLNQGEVYEGEFKRQDKP